MIGRRVVLDRLLHRAHRRPFGSRHPHGCGELGLAAGSAEEHHQPPGDGLGDVGAVVVLDHRECHVDPGGDAGRGPQLAVDGCRSDRDRRRALGNCSAQSIGPGPVGGHRVTVEQPGLGGEERAGAHRAEPAGAGSGTAQPVDEHLVVAGLLHPEPAGHQHGVDPHAGPGEWLGQWVGADRQPALGPDRSAGGRHHADVVGGRVAGCSSILEQLRSPDEHLERPDDVERLGAGEGDDQDRPGGAVAHDPSVLVADDGVNATHPTYRAMQATGGAAP